MQLAPSIRKLLQFYKWQTAAVIVEQDQKYLDVISNLKDQWKWNNSIFKLTITKTESTARYTPKSHFKEIKSSLLKVSKHHASKYMYVYKYYDVWKCF